MTVTDAAYVAALEKKLVEAERALYGFRAIWNNFAERTNRLRESDPSSDTGQDGRGVRQENVGGLYPGQYPDPTTDECVE